MGTHRWILPALVATGVAIAALLGVLVSNNLTDGFDLAIIDLVRSEALLAPLAPLRQVTAAGSTGAVTAVAIVLLGGMALARRPKLGLIASLAIALAATGNSLLKLLVARVRPDALEALVQERGLSFPSGHSMLGTVTWGIVAVIVARSRLPRPLRMGLVTALIALIFLIGISRIYLGVHFPSDVLAGWITGAVVVLLFAAATSSGVRWPGGEAADADPGVRRSDPPAEA